MNLLAMMMVAMLTIGFTSCGDDEENENPNNGQPVNPGTTVNDPEGTISLSMRNADNGNTYLDNIYISNENFRGAYFASVGAVKGLGNVSAIPSTGWAEQMSVIEGNGYVAYSNNQFYRIYVVSDIVGTTGGVIGADIKYQKPFKGVDEAISIDEKTLTFDANGGSQSLVFNNRNIIIFDAASDQSWCRVDKSSTNEYFFLYNAVTISVEPSSELAEETANVTIKSVYGKEMTIKVTRAGAEPVLTAETSTKEITPDAQTFQIGINTNYDVNDLQVSGSNDWLSAKIVDGTNGTRARAAQIKFIGESYATRAGSNNSAAKSYYLEVTAKSNYNSTARQGTITVKGKDGKKSANISINQQNAELSIENNTLSLTAREVSSASQTFRSTIKPEYLQISSDASWCNVWLDNNKSGNFYYSVTANTTGKERKATITIKPNEGNLSVKMNITQLKAVVYISKEKLWFDRNTGNQTVTITDDLDNWEVESSSASWCSFTRTGNNLFVRVEATNEDREAIIRIKGYDKFINIKQSKYAVGDNYKEGDIEGDVCYMQDENRIVCSLLGQYLWSTENIETGAVNEDDGQYNTNKIKEITNWNSLYPAFAACEELNNKQKTNRWYIPASNEAAKYIGQNARFQLTSTEASISECFVINRYAFSPYAIRSWSKNGPLSVNSMWGTQTLITYAILKF